MSLTIVVEQLPCFLEAVPKICKKGVTDYACQCSHTDELRPLINPCVLANCTSQADQLSRSSKWDVKVAERPRLISIPAETAQISLEVCSAFYKAAAALKLTKTIDIPTGAASGPTAYRPSGSGGSPATAVPFVGALLAGVGAAFQFAL